ncbi:transposase [Rhodococcus erythropolis]|nr:transposase [Rhodococcus erythropolis]MBY6382505.1 transposase [Rhodococcus erythropolis]
MAAPRLLRRGRQPRYTIIGDSTRKLRHGDELAAKGTDVEEIARQLDVSVPTLYNWRKQYGGMKADDAKEFKELKNENALLKKLLAEAELEKAALKEIAKGKF